jgi:hypothetical protein
LFLSVSLLLPLPALLAFPANKKKNIKKEGIEELVGEKRRGIGGTPPNSFLPCPYK